MFKTQVKQARKSRPKKNFVPKLPKQFCNAKPLSVLVFSYITITTWAYSRDLQVIQMTVLKPTKTENLGKFKSYCTLFNLYKANTIIVVKDNRLEMH